MERSTEQASSEPEATESARQSAGGAKETEASRWPPAAATEDLLKRVGALLSSSETLEAHLTSDMDFEPCEPSADKSQASMALHGRMSAM